MRKFDQITTENTNLKKEILELKDQVKGFKAEEVKTAAASKTTKSNRSQAKEESDMDDMRALQIALHYEEQERR